MELYAQVIANGKVRAKTVANDYFKMLLVIENINQCQLSKLAKLSPAQNYFAFNLC